MKIKFKKLHPDAKMPQKAHDDDFCYDVWAVSEEEVAPNVWRYGLGIAIEYTEKTPRDVVKAAGVDLNYGLAEKHVLYPGLTIRPRSSIYKTGMVLSNSIATIDNYRGQIYCVFYHVLPNMPRYSVGDKIAQLHLDWSEKIDWEEVKELSDSDRGATGFGDSGLK